MALKNLKFWKKKEGAPRYEKEFEKFDKMSGKFPRFEETGEFKGAFGEGKSTFGEEPDRFALPPTAPPPLAPPMRESPFEGNDAFIIKKDIEVISSKLDAIRSALESLNQRIANLERIAAGEEPERRRQW